MSACIWESLGYGCLDGFMFIQDEEWSRPQLYDKIYQNAPFANWDAYPHLTGNGGKWQYSEQQKMWAGYQQRKTVLPPDMVWLAGPGNKKEQLLKHSSKKAKPQLSTQND